MKNDICTVDREWLTFTPTQSLMVTCLAKPVLTMESRVGSLHPLASALYARSADPTNSGETGYAIPYSGTEYSVGIVVSVGSDSQTRPMFRRLGARLNVLKELIPNRKKPQTP
jgi:hypothetical protein